MRTCAATRSRLPPEPWLSSTAVRLRDGTYQPDSSRPSAVSIATSWWGMPSEDSWIAQRGACVTIRAIANGMTTSRAKTGTAASQPAPWASRQPSAGRRGARRGAAIAVRPAATSRSAAGDHAHAGDVGPVRSGVHDVEAVRDDAEAERQQADDDAEDEPRRPRDVRLGQRPGDRDGDDREHAGQRGVGAGERQVEQVERDEREPGEQERALEPARRCSAPAVRRASSAALGRGSVRVAVIACKPRAERAGADMGDGRRPRASGVAAAVRPAVPSQPRREASGWAHDGASDARHRGGGPALRSRRRAARARQRALPRSRRLGGVRAGGRVELRRHGPVCVASPARVALRPADGPGGVRVVPRAALRRGLAARVHLRHRPQRPLGPDLRPSCC